MNVYGHALGNPQKHLKQMLKRHDNKYGGLQELKADCTGGFWCPYMEFRILSSSVGIQHFYIV